MKNNCLIEFDVNPTSPEFPLSLKVELDGQIVWENSSITEPHRVEIDVDDEKTEDHSLKWIVGDKKPEYTKIDQEGNIVSDSLLQIKNFHISKIELMDYLHSIATYTHDFNGSKEKQTGPMYPDLGCNGVAELKFSTPLYLWLLENL
jgi:hypothetical protein